VALAICVAAREMFGSGGAALWVRVEDGIEMIARDPPVRALPKAVVIDFEGFPSFEEDMRSGGPRFVPDVEAQDPELWRRYARHTGSRSQLRLPLASAGLATALIVLSWPSRTEGPTTSERALAARFADQAAVALAEAGRRDARAAVEDLRAQFEQSLLPTIAVARDDVEVHTLYRPGDDRLRLGGDFVDCLELPDGRLVALIGDVAGHGPRAAALGAGMRSAWRGLMLAGTGLVAATDALHRVLGSERDDADMFVTAIVAELDPVTRTLWFVSAGHPPPIATSPEVVFDPRSGPPLGIEPRTAREIVEVGLPPGCGVLLYTDGLVEGRAARGADERFGLERLRELVQRPGARLDAGGLASLLHAATEANAGGLPDDVAMLSLRPVAPGASGRTPSAATAR
jgi:serine phosphatase RsbU (regulator of sigma subunit)